MRPSVSTPPPGLEGTMSLTVLSGQAGASPDGGVCAKAEAAQARSAAAQTDLACDDMIISMQSRGGSVGAQPEIPHQLAPAPDVGVDDLCVLFGRGKQHFGAERVDALLYLAGAHEFVDLGIDAIDDRARRARRCQQSKPGAGLETRYASFRHSRDVRRDRGALGAGGAELEKNT